MKTYSLPPTSRLLTSHPLRKLIICIITIVIIATLINQAEAKASSNIKIKVIGGEVITGTLLFVQGDSIGLTNKKSGLQIIRLSQILSIHIRNKKRMGRSILAGAGVGAVIGAGLFFAASSRCQSYCIDKGTMAGAGAVFGACTGMLIGALAGTEFKEVPINFDQSSFDHFKKEYNEKIKVQAIKKDN